MLFWRIPETDFIFPNLHTVYEKYIQNFITEKKSVQKIHKCLILFDHIHEIIKNGRKDEIYINIHESPENIYLIGDNPIIFRKTPEVLNEFNDFDFLFALSSKRIYSSTNQSLKKFGLGNAIIYNAGVISQSKKYVACSNLAILKESIECYEDLKKHNIVNLINERVFITPEAS